MSYVCQICNKIIQNHGMSSHIIRTHKMDTKTYYDTYIEPNTKHVCVCGKPTNYKNLSTGYYQYCCCDCSRRDNLIKTREKYGVTNISQVPFISQKMRKSIKKSWDAIPENQRNYRNKLVDESVQIYCAEHNLSPIGDIIAIYGTGFLQDKDLLDISFTKYKNRLLVSNNYIPIIEQYTNMNVRSKHETYIYNLVKSYYDDAVQNKRILGKKELDIYVPSIQLGIEYNGFRYHSIESGKEKDYHLVKSLLCREKGIRLIHIYQFEDFSTQMQLLIDYLNGIDNYPKEDFNKNNLLPTIPKPQIIYKSEKYTIYGAGELY